LGELQENGESVATVDTGIKATIDLSSSLGGKAIIDSAYAALPAEAQLAYSKVSGDVKNSIAKATELYSSVKPAISMAEKIGKGSPVNEMEVVGALSAVATMAGGPIVGAAVGAIGSAAVLFEGALIGFFTSLGLYDQAPKYVFMGYVRKHADVVPSGPEDPNWIHIDNLHDLNELLFNGLQGKPPLNNESGWDHNMFKLLTWTLETLMTDDERCKWYSGGWQGGHWVPSNTCDKQWKQWMTESHAIPSNEFEKYLALILKKNLQNWINAGPFINPRDILRNAKDTWNMVHQSTDVKKYYPAKVPLKTTSNLIEAIMSQEGDFPNFLGNMSQIAVNMGPTVSIPVPPITLSKQALRLRATRARLAAEAKAKEQVKPVAHRSLAEAMASAKSVPIKQVAKQFVSIPTQKTLEIQQKSTHNDKTFIATGASALAGFMIGGPIGAGVGAAIGYLGGKQIFK
jgi:hypothetical protein